MNGPSKSERIATFACLTVTPAPADSATVPAMSRTSGL
jgi:hypothetical protein